MTTEAQLQAQQEQPDDSNSVWRVLGRLEANQQTMLRLLVRQETRIDGLEVKVSGLEANQQTMLQLLVRQETRIDGLEVKVSGLEVKASGLDVKANGLEANQQTMLQRMDKQDARMDTLEAKMDRLLYFMVGAVIANIGAMAAGFWAVTAALSN